MRGLLQNTGKLNPISWGPCIADVISEAAKTQLGADGVSSACHGAWCIMQEWSKIVTSILLLMQMFDSLSNDSGPSIALPKLILRASQLCKPLQALTARVTASAWT